jgi:hypothetical protein
VNLADGYLVEIPPVLIPWGVGVAEIELLLPGTRRVTDGYLTLEVVSLGGLAHVLGFHFEPRIAGRLVELELFSRSSAGPSATYESFERHLEETFGAPTTTLPGDVGFPEQRWDFAGVGVIHLVRERFGPEEIVRIRRF